MRYIIDRFEGAFAVCEDESGAFRNIEKSKLPKGIRSGDVVVFEEGSVFVDRAASDKRRTEIIALQNSLWGRRTDK